MFGFLADTDLLSSFIDSLSAKVHPTPPTVDKLAILFQDFYAVAATHINTHIAAISSRQHRANSPAPSVSSSLSSTASKIRAKAVSISSKERPKIPERKDSQQQMLTPQEIAERKRARKALEVKRLALEEAVERRVCEKIYGRIWRHRSTSDEAQDEKLRSKTAALSVVGIGLTDLGIDLGEESSEDDESDEETITPDRETEVRQWLEGARKELIAMNDQKYPLGKLQHLKAAHKSIVDTLTNFHPSSSADEIMPMLIYTLITSRPEGIDVISNLYFIQRFRNESKIDGEAAYCLTNLEAAVTFLETVDLASLRADEAPSGPLKPHSRPNTPKAEKFDTLTSGVTPSLGVVPAELSSTSATSTMSKSAVSPSTLLRPSMKDSSRRLSDMFQPPAAFGAAGDAVMNSADQGLKNIGDSLGNSYKFLLGKLKERQDESAGDKDSNIPKTLEDARKLVSTPPPEDEETASGASSLHSPESERKRTDSETKQDDKLLNMIGGRKMVRDRSVDSSRSAGSNKKVSFTPNGGEKAPSPLHKPPPPGLSETPAAPSANPAIVESMRNLGNSLNPMSRIAGMGMMRGFGRQSPLPSPTTSTSKPIPDLGVAELSAVSLSDLSLTTFLY